MFTRPTGALRQAPRNARTHARAPSPGWARVRACVADVRAAQYQPLACQKVQALAGLP